MTLAYACLIRGTGKTIALYGRNAEKVRAEVADLRHGLQFVPMATVDGSDNVEVCRDAGIPVRHRGLFFFLEAIFAGIYLWGWERLPGWAHWWSGMPIALSGIFGAMAVVAVNSWMNQPGGFTEHDGQITAVNPWQVLFNRAAIYEMPHMILAAYMVSGYTVAGVYAAGLLRGR